jgi:hypothetical protein
MIMSLMRLLAAGKSLVGGRDAAGRYRLSKHAALPKFITSKKPFAVARVEARPPRPVIPQKPPRPVRPLIQKLNPLSFLAAVKLAPKPAHTAFPKAPVQGVLSLDKVKVVRNDLSDADLEVVPVKSSVARQGGERTLAAVSTGKPAGTPWEQWTARIFGARQT